MRRTNIIRICPAKKQEKILRLMGDRVSALWNAANYLYRQSYFKNERVPSYEKSYHLFKTQDDYKALPTHIAQEGLKKLSKAWKSYFELLRLYKTGRLQDKPGLPKYRKDRKIGERPFNYIPIQSTRAYSLENGCLNITLPKDIRNGRLSIPFKGIIRYCGSFKTCELKYEPAARKWYAHIVVEVSEPQRKERPIKYAAADLGARRIIAASIQDSSINHVFHSKQLRKDYKYWTRQIAEEQSRLSNCTGTKTSRKLKQLYRMRGLRFKHGLETLSSNLVSLLKRKGVTQFKIGYPKNCREDMHFGRNNGLVHNFWSFDKLLRILEKHCKRRGINLERINEAGTSDICHICGLPVRRPMRSVVICPIHGRMHADVNASLNMLKRYTPVYGDRAKAAPAWITHEWNKHLWLPHAKSLKYIQNLQVAA